MSRLRGGRHRDPADSRRRMFLAILLAFALSGATTSLWALDSPLDETGTSTEALPTTEVEASPTASHSLPDVQIDEASIQTQDAETTEPDEEPSEPDETTESDSGQGGGDSVPEPDLSREQALVESVNNERAGAGCGALESNAKLDAAAKGHAEDMAANDYFSHTSQDGRTPTDRAAEQGYRGGVGENIAAGYRDVASVMNGWMNSEGHRANILNCNYSVIGVGIADRSGTLYWVQNFG